MRLHELDRNALVEMYLISTVPSDSIRDGFQCAKAYAKTTFAQIGDITIRTGRDGKVQFFRFVADQTIVGFAELTDWTAFGIKGSVMSSIYLSPDWQAGGVGFKFYRLLLDKGFTLASGVSQTRGGQAMWHKLMTLPDIEILAMTGYEDDDPPGRLVDVSTLDPWSKGNSMVQLIARRRG